jgi:hypothetical protein
MAKKSPIHTVRVVLKLPTRIADFIVTAQKIHDQMAANTTTLPSPNPTLIILQPQIDSVNTKEALVKARASGSVADRDAAIKVLAVSLNSERAYVESVCNATPTNALSIAEDAGMTLRTVPVREKPPLAAKAGKVSGTVLLAAKATKGAKANSWQYSADGGKTWIDLPQTTKASTSVANLTPGTTVEFHQRVLTKTGVSDWGQTISHLVT